MKAVLHHAADAAVRALVEAHRPPWLEVAIVAERQPEALRAALADAAALLHVLEPVTAAVIESAPALRLIQKIGVGVNTIDLAAARQAGVAVANMPGTNTAAVAEMTLLLMLAVLRRVVLLDHATRAGDGWGAAAQRAGPQGELAGRTVGLVGFGAVGRRLAPVLEALGASVVYTATAPKPDAPVPWRSLDDLLREADVVSLHLPLTPETGRLLDARRLELMKPGAVLVNTARGGLVDEDALAAALDSGRLAGAGLDTFAVEPAPAGTPLLARDAVVATPHVAWLTRETWARSLGVAFENCRRLRDGEPLRHRVA